MMVLWTLIALVMLSEAFLHYFPWKLLLRGKELPRLAAYSLGLLGMMVPLSVWLWQRGEVEILRVLWLVVGSAGLIVFALYGLDRYIELEWQNMEAREREQALRQSHGSQG
jgi:hypothetical protein